MKILDKPKPLWRTGTDHARFDCVWKAAFYTLASQADHRKHKIGIPGGPDEDKYLLVDSRYRLHRVPKSEVHITQRQW